MLRFRAALYSHDTVGLGHTRRQLAIAEAIAAAHPEVDLLLLTGNPEAARLPVPPRTDLITLPTVTKNAAGTYIPRRQGGALEDVLTVRSAVLAAALTAFAPDLLIIDKVPAGLGGELLGALEALRREGTGTRVVLGLREILDDAATVHREWARDSTLDVIREHIDEVWVYGDPSVFDTVREYDLPADIAARTMTLGYLGRRPRPRVLSSADPDLGPGSAAPPASPFVLCQLGGGQDAEAMARAFVAARLPDGHEGVLLTGPFLPAPVRRDLERLAAARSAAHGRIRVREFTDAPEELLHAASAVVSMSGCNSSVEILGSTVPALLVPRTRPRTEQLTRARALAARGAVDVLAPSDPGGISAGALTDWLEAAVVPGAAAAASAARARIDLDGLDAVAARTLSLIEEARHAA
jgi:predicted glycosyltransferase